MIDQVEAVARAIAHGLGDNLDHAFTSKTEWTQESGSKGGRYRDVNEPYQPDYLEAAIAAIAAMQPQEPTEAKMKAGTYVLSEWWNHNAPIGEHIYGDSAVKGVPGWRVLPAQPTSDGPSSTACDDQYSPAQPDQRIAKLVEALRQISQCEYEYCEGMPVGLGPPALSDVEANLIATETLAAWEQDNE